MARKMMTSSRKSLINFSRSELVVELNQFSQLVTDSTNIYGMSPGDQQTPGETIQVLRSTRSRGLRMSRYQHFPKDPQSSSFELDFSALLLPSGLVAENSPRGEACDPRVKPATVRITKGIELSRRRLMVGAVAFCVSMSGRPAKGAGAEMSYDFTGPLAGWETVKGRWEIEDVPGALRSGKALVQRATNNDFDVIVAPGGPYTNVAVDVRFKPISGREDASGGIVFRFSEGHYYVIRANSLEENFAFYYYAPKSLGARVMSSCDRRSQCEGSGAWAVA